MSFEGFEISPDSSTLVAPFSESRFVLVAHWGSLVR
jgi:hypothetical protein